MTVPKIVWGSGGPNTLVFAFPPTKQPATWVEAEREDSIATGGEKQTIITRLDEFIELAVSQVPEGTDASLGQVEAWKTFMKSCALLGMAFDYYPDSTQGDFFICTLEDKRFKPELQFRGTTRLYRFDLKLRVSPL